MFVKVSAGESTLQQRIARLTSKGRTDKALRIYDRRWTAPGNDIMSAATHYAAFVAARDDGLGLDMLMVIHRRAQKCTDYAASALNFAREWAVFTAEVSRDFDEAKSAIKEVIRGRTDDEGQDLTQLLGDRFALCKIFVLSGSASEAQYCLQVLMEEAKDTSPQIVPDIAWWYFVATTMIKDYRLANKLARMSLSPCLDHKPFRRRIRYLTCAPFIGPRAARFMLRRELRL